MHSYCTIEKLIDICGKQFYGVVVKVVTRQITICKRDVCVLPHVSECCNMNSLNVVLSIVT